ncbi:MAG: P44/Msp2 family outer membrane protein, partial [Anaplasma sp.]
IPAAAEDPIPMRKDATREEALLRDGFRNKLGELSDPTGISFQLNNLLGFSGAVGYARNDIRGELEVGCERWPVSRVRGRSWEEGDSVFLFPRVGETALRKQDVYIYNMQRTAKAASELLDDVYALRLQSILHRMRGADRLARQYGNAYKNAMVEPRTATNLLSRVAEVHKPAGKYSKFVTTTLEWATAADRARFASALVAPATEEGVIIKVPRVGVTTATANVCYDATWNTIGGVTPYACLGAGLSFIRIVEGNVAEFSGKTGFGLGYEVIPGVTMFVEVMYHRAAHYDKYNIRVTPLTGSEARFEHSQAHLSCSLSYIAWGAGMRVLL